MSAPDVFAECKANGCGGCFGALMSCGHTFNCVRDPALDKHRCAASWTPVLWPLFMALAVFAVVFFGVHR